MNSIPALPNLGGADAAPNLSISPMASPLRGVNLGGFLILEPYLKPALFAAACDRADGAACPIDEHSLCETLGSIRARAVMHEHWDTWVSFDELRELRDAGINALRIPVGYWIVAPRPGEPYVEGGLQYLIRVCKWAQALGMRVVVELHGAPGRQNNMDHSGWKDHMGWQVSPCADVPSDAYEHSVETLEVLRRLIEVLEEHALIRACSDSAAGHSERIPLDASVTPCGTVVGIGLLNEPISFDKERPVDHAALVGLYAEALQRLVPRHVYAFIDMFEGFGWLIDEGVADGRERFAFDKHRCRQANRTGGKAHTRLTHGSHMAHTRLTQGSHTAHTWLTHGSLDDENCRRPRQAVRMGRSMLGIPTTPPPSQVRGVL